MSSHIHMIVGSKGRPLDKIIGEMKSFTSRSLRRAISEHTAESKREWMLNFMEKSGIRTAITMIGNYGNNTTIPLRF